MAPNDEQPFGIFRRLYTIATWSSVALTAAITIWLLWTLFENSPVGTAQSERLAIARPTMTALALLVPAPTSGPLAALPPSCAACHAIAGQGGTVCPDLTNVAATALERLGDPDYSGSATTAEEYILESIVDPNAYIVPGQNSPSVMPPGGGIQDDQLIQKTVEFLLQQH